MSKKRPYPARLPRAASGIRLQERGSCGVWNWWARRWQDAIEKMAFGARIGKGRNYAVSGQVLEISLPAPHVAAKVMGARPDPYELSFDFRVPSPEARRRIVGSIAAEPIVVARILAGDLPMEVEAAFRAEGLDLFPGAKLAPGKYDMTTKCSCPDYANPCKHCVAALYVLGEEIARRPAALLELRGISIEELVG